MTLAWNIKAASRAPGSSERGTMRGGKEPPPPVRVNAARNVSAVAAWARSALLQRGYRHDTDVASTDTNACSPWCTCHEHSTRRISGGTTWMLSSGRGTASGARAVAARSTKASTEVPLPPPLPPPPADVEEADGGRSSRHMPHRVSEVGLRKVHLVQCQPPSMLRGTPQLRQVSFVIGVRKLQAAHCHVGGVRACGGVFEAAVGVAGVAGAVDSVVAAAVAAAAVGFASSAVVDGVAGGVTGASSDGRVIFCHVHAPRSINLTLVRVGGAPVGGSMSGCVCWRS